MQFEEALKNSNAYKSLAKDADTGNVAHAYMFVSPDETALLSLAELSALRLFCDKGGCGKCPACAKILHRNHSDVVFVNEDLKKIKVEDVADIVDDSIVKSNEGGKKLYVICGADQMTQAAQNKLLKTLEEPPQDVIFFLLTSNEQAMLDTVRSRVRKIALECFSPDVVYNEIFKKTGSSETAEVAAACSGGMLGKADKIAADEGYKLIYSEAFDILFKLTKSSDVAPLLGRKVFVRENFGILLDVMSIIFRDVLVADGDGELSAGTFEKENVKKLAAEFSAEAVGKIIYLINDERKKLFFNVSQTAVAENLLMGILQIKYNCKKQ